MLDLTRNQQGFNQHQKILSVGTDPDLGSLTPHLNAVNLSFLDTPVNESNEKALELTLLKPGVHYGDDTNAINVIVRMASLCYTHSATFIKDLSLCLTEFSDYMLTVGTTIKHAATEVAIGFVQGKSEFLSTSFYGGNPNLDTFTTENCRKRHMSLDPEDHNESMDIQDNEAQDTSMEMKLDVMLQTPVIMIPRKPSSPEVLVMHLGKISIRNHKSLEAHALETDFTINQLDFAKPGTHDKIHLEIRDMNMYSMNLEQQHKLQQTAEKGHTMTKSMFNTPQPGGFIKTSYGTPILHDTMLELTIQHSHTQDNLDNQNTTLLMQPGPEFKHQAAEGSVINVVGRVVTPLKVTLSKEVYEQILQTLDHLTPEDDLSLPQRLSEDPSSTTDEEVDSENPLSSLKFYDNSQFKPPSPKEETRVQVFYFTLSFQ